MIPQIVDITETEHGLFYATSTGKICASFKTDVLDLENPYTSEQEIKIEYLLRQIPANMTCLFQLTSAVSNSPPFSFSRSQAFSEVGFLDQKLFIHFEISNHQFLSGAATLIKSVIKRVNDPHLYIKRVQDLYELIPFDLFKNSGMPLAPCTLEEVQGFFPPNNIPIIQTDTGLRCNGEHVGAIKLYKLRSDSSKTSLAKLRMDFPQPYQISTRLSKVPEGKLKALLDNSKKQEEKKSGSKAAEKAEAKDLAITAADNHGAKFLYLESHILIKRSSEAELLRDLKSIAQRAYSFGEFTQETSDGCEQSFSASLPGGDNHLLTNIMEKDSSISCYLPLFSYGTSIKEPESPSALAYHRRDMSIGFHETTSRLLPNKMQNIIARAGSGKSVMLNLLIESLAEDPKSTIYIIDVAGSHTRTVLNLGGNVSEVTLDSVSPVNPFRHLIDPSPSVISISKNCLVDLLLEKNETSMPTAESYYIDDAILRYIESGPKNPSIHDFIEFIFPSLDDTKTLFPKFPRKEHLLRFSKKGMYKNIFSKSNSEEERHRIQYSNIQQISSATNPAVAKAITASRFADFWIKVETKSKDEPIYFIVDEAPMVIQHNFTSLTHQTTNTRKENGSLILVSQKAEQLVVGGNTTLLSNAGTNIFLGPDDKLEEFKEALQLSFDDIDEIRRLHMKPGEYSQFFVKNAISSHMGMILLGKEEYWRITSTPEERARIESLQKILPNLKPNQIARIIAECEREVLT